MRKAYIAIAIFSSLLLSSCNKNIETVEEGFYKGTFTVTYSNGTQQGPTSLELKNGSYYCAGNSNRIPAGGSGTYTINGDKITFTDQNYWTADFDGNLILDGTYSFTINGNELKIFADKNNVGHYAYNLQKQ